MQTLTLVSGSDTPTAAAVVYLTSEAQQCESGITDGTHVGGARGLDQDATDVTDTEPYTFDVAASGSGAFSAGRYKICIDLDGAGAEPWMDSGLSIDWQTREPYAIQPAAAQTITLWSEDPLWTSPVVYMSASADCDAGTDGLHQYSSATETVAVPLMRHSALGQNDSWAFTIDATGLTEGQYTANAWDGKLNICVDPDGGGPSGWIDTDMRVFVQSDVQGVTPRSLHPATGQVITLIAGGTIDASSAAYITALACDEATSDGSHAISSGASAGADTAAQLISVDSAGQKTFTVDMNSISYEDWGQCFPLPPAAPFLSSPQPVDLCGPPPQARSKSASTQTAVAPVAGWTLG